VSRRAAPIAVLLPPRAPPAGARRCLRQDELESHLVAAPVANWHEAAEKARYLRTLFAIMLAAQDPRRQKLTAAVLMTSSGSRGNPSRYRKLQERMAWRKGN